MSNILDFQTAALKVFSILTDNEEARDNDLILLVEIWGKESTAPNVDGFLTEIKEGKLTHFETIRRMRQKLQEKHPTLRGKCYETRHNMEGAVCSQLTFFDKW